jgi:hypothetical protein
MTKQRPVMKIPVPSDRAWFDGQLLTAATEVSISEFVWTAPGANLVAPANPNRIAIGFIPLQGMANDQLIAPWPDPQSYPLADLSTGLAVWFKLWDYPGIIGNKWYGYSPGAFTFRFVEILRQP